MFFTNSSHLQSKARLGDWKTYMDLTRVFSGPQKRLSWWWHLIYGSFPQKHSLGLVIAFMSLLGQAKTNIYSGISERSER